MDRKTIDRKIIELRLKQKALDTKLVAAIPDVSAFNKLVVKRNAAEAQIEYLQKLLKDKPKPTRAAGSRKLDLVKEQVEQMRQNNPTMSYEDIFDRIADQTKSSPSAIRASYYRKSKKPKK